MKLVEPSIKFLWMTEKPLQAIEIAGRTCYKSEKNVSKGSAKLFVENLLLRKHHAMIEHASASYRVICDRGVTHEIVRHRLFSYAQESTRFCNYSGGVTFVVPPWTGYLDTKDAYSATDDEARKNIHGPECHWLFSMQVAEEEYQALLKAGWTPQQARSVLPNSLKTEIVITGNLREWRHFFSLRCTPKNIPEERRVDGIFYGAGAPHPQMQEVANMVLKDIRARVPVLFEEF